MKKINHGRLIGPTGIDGVGIVATQRVPSAGLLLAVVLQAALPVRVRSVAGHRLLERAHVGPGKIKRWLVRRSKPVAFRPEKRAIILVEYKYKYTYTCSSRGTRTQCKSDLTCVRVCRGNCVQLSRCPPRFVRSRRSRFGGESMRFAVWSISYDNGIIRARRMRAHN